jgi:Methyltransferase domain
LRRIEGIPHDLAGLSESKQSSEVSARAVAPAPLCGHPIASGSLVLGGSTASCPVCGSFWDLAALAAPLPYDETYCESRLHSDPAAGQLKLRTLLAWLATVGIEVGARVVCEVGFGGAHVLRGLMERGATVSGVETNPAAIASAIKLGIPADRLFRADSLPARLDPLVDLWLFLDSFEHLPNPSAFVSWLTRSSTDSAVVLLVAPDATSRSARILGRAWPHRLRDHHFHWSRDGLAHLWGREGWHTRSRFAPVKWISPATVASHALLKLGMSESRAKDAVSWIRPLQRVRLPFNIGELGLVLARSRPVATK